LNILRPPTGHAPETNLPIQAALKEVTVRLGPGYPFRTFGIRVPKGPREQNAQLILKILLHTTRKGIGEELKQ
jgi:hypothetical protein